MEERLLQAEKLRAVGEMAGGVAHDFNNALAIILGNTQLLLESVQDEELLKLLKAIEGRLRRVPKRSGAFWSSPGRTDTKRSARSI